MTFADFCSTQCNGTLMRSTHKMCENCEGSSLEVMAVEISPDNFDDNCAGSISCNEDCISASGQNSILCEASTFDESGVKEPFTSGHTDMQDTLLDTYQLETSTSDYYTSGSSKTDTSNFDVETHVDESSISDKISQVKISQSFGVLSSGDLSSGHLSSGDLSSGDLSNLEKTSINNDTLICLNCDIGFALSDDLLSCNGECQQWQYVMSPVYHFINTKHYI